VVKVPYSNAGQGVYTITSEKELEDFLAEEKDHNYDKFIVQSLIGNSKWSSREMATGDRLYHVGSIPNKKGEIYVCDLRMQISQGPKGFELLGMYARRAKYPLADALTPEGRTSWEMLGTNLSVKAGNSWEIESERLLIFDTKDFHMLGMGVDDLIDGFVQTVLASLAIDKMAEFLVKDDYFSPMLFRSLNDDPALLKEIRMA